MSIRDGASTESSIPTKTSLDTDGLRSLIKHDPSWEELRKRITPEALHLADKVIFDFRRLLTDPSASYIAGKLLWRMLKGLSPEVLVGPGYGATPLLHSIAAAALEEGVHLSVLQVHDPENAPEIKSRWVTGTLVEGHVRAVVVDDFMDSGTAYAVVRYGLDKTGLKLNLLVFALFFDMWQPLGSRQLSVAELPVVSLYRRHDIGMSRDAYDARPPLMKGEHSPFISEQPLWWKFALNENTTHPRKSSPAIADNAVFVADDDSRVWRHHAVTGDVEWCYESLAKPSKGIVQQLQYADGSLVFGCYDGTVTRLDGKTGNVIWRWRQDSSVHSTPEVDLNGSRVFINTEQWNAGDPFGHLQALEWETGRLIWKVRHAWWPPGTPVYDAHSNLVVATCNDLSIAAVDADSGDVIWRASTKGLVRGKPAIEMDRLFVLTERGFIECFDLQTGNLIWSKRYGKGLAHQFVTVVDNVVLAFDNHWHLLAFSKTDGTLIWLSRLRSRGTWCPIICSGNIVALSQQGHIALLAKNSGMKIWEGSIAGRYEQPPAIGTSTTGPILAAASNDIGLKIFHIDPTYWNEYE